LPAHPDLIARRGRSGAAAAGGARLGCRQIGHPEDLARNHQFEAHDLVQRQYTDDHRG
jgi:hypothetical protein